MRSILFSVSLLSAGLAFAVPAVSNVTLEQRGADHRVVVRYDLANAPAIVTVDFQANGVSIGFEKFSGVWGDVNRRIEASGSHEIYWNPDRDWKGDPTDLKAVVTAWEPDNPPDYLVVGLETPNDVRYYVSTNALPSGGLANDIYRLRKLVLRRIPAKNVQWRMGAPTTEPGVTTKDGVQTDTRTNETTHLVTLTSDYYMGIYELTQRQYLTVRGWTHENPSCFKGDQRPLETIMYNDVRNPDWPNSGRSNVGSSTFMGAVRARTGVEFDLPTEAQWEYACRAGTSTGYNNGQDLEGMESTGALAPLAWYNSADGQNTKNVGLKQPNAWGLYDMHGNVFEFCLDRCNKADLSMAGDAVRDPTGQTSGDQRIMRGGCFESKAYLCRSAARSKVTDYNGVSNARGVRLVCPIGLKW